MTAPTRFREVYPEYACDLGVFQPGPFNAITDVPGVRVGHATVHDRQKHWYTGVTAIWPRDDVYDFRPRASGHVLHGAGEMTGLHQALEYGFLETPILLTSTLAVGKAYDGALQYLIEKHPEMGLSEDVLIPVVAECDDSYLSRSRERPIGVSHVKGALEAARGGPVPEGSVGAGTGMIAFDFKAGIGTSSRRIPAGPAARRTEFMLGALVNANVGVRRQLRAAGRWVGRKLEAVAPIGREPAAERSIIVVLACGAPLRPDQLRRLSVRAALGLGRVGSFASHSSGEIVIAFSTALGEPRKPASATQAGEWLHDSFLNPFYEAAAECVEEAVLNALVAATPIDGRDGHRAVTVPQEPLRDALRNPS